MFTLTGQLKHNLSYQLCILIQTIVIVGTLLIDYSLYVKHCPFIQTQEFYIDAVEPR